MQTLYLDTFSGISGDMFLGALLDLGVPFDRLESELKKLGVEGYTLEASRRTKANIAGIKFDVRLRVHAQPHSLEPQEEHQHEHTHEHHHDPGHSHAHEHQHGHGHEHQHESPSAHPHAHPDEGVHSHPHVHGRSFADIRSLIRASSLDDWVKQKAIAIFERVAVAEGKVHGKPVDEVHFHEVGALDSIVDIVGACIALNILGRPRVLAANVVEGTGWVQCAHGRFPVPTAATLEILGARGVAVTQCDEPHELVTPTGAALLAEFVDQFGPMQGLVARRIGYGLGTRDNHTRPNVLRAILGEAQSPTAQAAHDWEIDQVIVLETNLDDISPELLGPVLERALADGALDAFHTPVQMKKGRPGVLLTVLCGEDRADVLTAMMLRETSAFGVRRTRADRRKLRRQSAPVDTPWGPVSVKVGFLDGVAIQCAPEYDSCRAVANQAGVSIRQVYEAALIQARLAWPFEKNL